VKSPVSLWRLAAVLVGALPALSLAATTPLSGAEVDRLVTRAMSAFSVPGIAVGIVKDGKLVYAKGFGVREVGRPGAVDADTQFAIGSNTKAFTTAALAILVDEGKLRWDDRVIDYLPDFRMSDPYVTREFTIRDLLTHRSGLGIGAGDLLFVTATDFTRRDMLRALRYLKPVTGFRSQFAYDNLLYVVAGEVIATVSGQSWEDFVTARILTPLGMHSCATAFERLPDHDNIAAPHLVVDGTLATIPRLEIPLAGPAGAIQCSINGMAKWVQTQLAHGSAPGGATLFSAAAATEMWTPQTLEHGGGKIAELTHTHFQAYGLGWGLDDLDGFKHVAHNGGLPGMVTQVSMIPELNLGVIVLTNQQEGFALSAISLPILEGYAGLPRRDWVSLMQGFRADRLKMVSASNQAHAVAGGAAPHLSANELAAFTGTFADPWRGEATIAAAGDGLRLTFSHTSDLSGPLHAVGPELFIVRWDKRTLDADAYVRFTRDYAGTVTGFTMKAVSASTDFSYDFQDLEFHRVRD